MRKMTMPVKKYKEGAGSGSSSSTSYTKLFKPLPNAGGEKYDNNVFVSLMTPETWKIFSPDSKMVERFSMNPSFRLSDPQGGSLNTFFMPLPMHWMEVERSDGTVGGSYVLCPQKMNEQLKTLLGNDVLFLEDRCACCEKEAKYWKIFNESWETSGFSKDSFKGNTQGYLDFVENNPTMKAARSSAMTYKATDRYIFNIFDLNKFWGTRPLDEGEQSPTFQVWFAPQQIFDNLYDIHNTYADNDLPNFYDITREGVLPVVITKDTTRCKGKDLRRTKYAVTASPVRKPLDAEGAWVTYLDNPANMVDPTDLFSLMTYEEMFASLGDNSDSSEVVSTRRSSMPRPAQQAPSNEHPTPTPPVASTPAPPVSTMSPPVAPPTASVPPQQQSRPTPPIPTQAPPVAPPTAANPTPPIPAVRRNDEVPDFIPGIGGDEW